MFVKSKSLSDVVDAAGLKLGIGAVASPKSGIFKIRSDEH